MGPAKLPQSFQTRERSIFQIQADDCHIGLVLARRLDYLTRIDRAGNDVKALVRLSKRISQQLTAH